MMYKILPNFLTQQEIFDVQRDTAGHFGSCSKFTPTKRMHSVHNRVFEEVKKFVPAESLAGVEQWGFHSDYHGSQLPTTHQDTDEGLLEAKGITKYPLCSAILYLNIRDLIGASLEIYEQSKPHTSIKPETGMVVLLAPGTWHAISAFQSGTRHSMNYNFWDVPLFNS
jgi:hypothetical protein